MVDLCLKVDLHQSIGCQVHDPTMQRQKAHSMADLGRLEGIVWRKVDFDYKDAASIGAVTRPAGSAKG